MTSPVAGTPASRARVRSAERSCGALLPVLRDDFVEGFDPLGDLCGHVLLDCFFHLCCHADDPLVLQTFLRRTSDKCGLMGMRHEGIRRPS